MLTLREHLEWIAAGHVDGNPLGWIVDATEHAAKTLDLLNSAAVVAGMPRDGDPLLRPVPHRLIPDPERAS